MGCLSSAGLLGGSSSGIKLFASRIISTGVLSAIPGMFCLRYSQSLSTDLRACNDGEMAS